MKTQLRQGEQVVKQGPANLQRNIEAVGGSLYLTNQRLVFESHSLNIQRGTTEIELSDVSGSVPCWTKYLGLIPVFPNSLAVSTMQGNVFRFVLFRRREWAAAIESQRKR